MPSIAATGRSLRSVSGRQRLAVPGNHDAAARSHRPATTTFASANDLASALRRAAAAHGKHEERTGGHVTKTGPTGTPIHGARAGRQELRNERLERDRHRRRARRIASVLWQRPACRARDLAAVSLPVPVSAQLKPCLHKKHAELPETSGPVVRRSWWRGVHEKHYCDWWCCACGAGRAGVGPGQATQEKPMVSQDPLSTGTNCLCAGEGHAAEVSGEDAGGKLQF